MKEKPKPSWRHTPVPYIVFACSLLLTFLLTLYFARAKHLSDELRFDNTVTSLEEGIRSRFAMYISSLRAGSGLYAASFFVERNEFRRFVDRLELDRNYPGLLGMGFSQRVLAANKNSAVQSFRRDIFPDFRIWPEYPRTEYHTILYLEPLNAINRKVIGFDMFTEPVRQEAMSRARDTGLPAVTGRVQLLQDPFGKAGILIYVPVYHGGETPTTVAERRRLLKGFIYSPCRIDDFLRAVYDTEDKRQLDVQIYDGATPLAASLLHQSRTSGLSYPFTLRSTRQIQIAGQMWTLVCQSTPFWQPNIPWLAIFFATGVLISLLLFALTWAQARSRLLAEQNARERKVVEDEVRRSRDELEVRVGERTQELSQANQALQKQMDDRLRMEQELSQSRKLEAVGRLAGGVAHDFNNLMTGITGLCEGLRNDLTLNATQRADIDEIIFAANRAAALTKQLLAFGRRQVTTPAILDLNQVISDMQKMLRRLIGEDIELLSLLDERLGSIKADPVQIEQILINLVINARDAMPAGGVIRIETKNTELDQAYSKRHFDVVPGPYVQLSVSDTGIGMDAETQSHVFEPFFTTKAKDKGTGLGLATVYGIVKQNGGDIALSSQPGMGTTFNIYLPRVSETRSIENKSPTPSIPIKGTETILLVEDEDIVRRVATRALRNQGYQVLEAHDGNEALELCRSWSGPIDLVLTDVIMPGMNGRQLAAGIAKIREDVRILYMSGYPENVIVNRGILSPGIAFIEKSFTSQILCQKVREVLDEHSKTSKA